MFGIRRQTVNQSINHQVNNIESVSILSEMTAVFLNFSDGVKKRSYSICLFSSPFFKQVLERFSDFIT